ncbi:MAG: ATP phosphoribosyltransferase regulatory subunit [Clostridiales bacterium]|jgi:histidyl-tRNA synthetase|nr:ATP phosphoribosyltransferase regulatory subunit [Clostridiales bacterium]
MKTTPVNGTKEYLPQEAELRDFLECQIMRAYRESGFRRIYTPILEDIDNLDKSDGGENLAIIFKVLKRGEKLEKAIAADGPLADLGLRYDLTLPLARFYANNRSKLPNPFKCIQIDRVYRAERPQKGRLREFRQCDIDIIGSSSTDCETELILVTASALQKLLGRRSIIVHINDRALLSIVLSRLGFDDLSTVCMTLDKYDKIGASGVLDELSAKGHDKTLIEKFLKAAENSASPRAFAALAGEGAADSPAASLSTIIDNVRTLSDVDIKFNPLLVRGQGYYTGAVFEIEAAGYPGSVAGGGRYDGMIGKFIGEDVPAVGFSIGFERIFDILSKTASCIIIPDKPKITLFYEESSGFKAVWRETEKLKEKYLVTLKTMPKKLGKALDREYSDGANGFMIFGKDEAPRMFEKERQAAEARV